MTDVAKNLYHDVLKRCEDAKGTMSQADYLEALEGLRERLLEAHAALLKLTPEQLARRDALARENE